MATVTEKGALTMAVVGAAAVIVSVVVSQGAAVDGQCASIENTAAV